jgi:hypothetical protein
MQGTHQCLRSPWLGIPQELNQTAISVGSSNPRRGRLPDSEGEQLETDGALN